MLWKLSLTPLYDAIQNSVSTPSLAFKKSLIGKVVEILYMIFIQHVSQFIRNQIKTL